MVKKYYAKYTAWVDNILERIWQRFNKPEIVYTELQTLINKIDPKYFKGYNNQLNALIKIKTPVENIGVYNKKLAEVNSWLEAKKEIYNQWGNEPLTIVIVSKFFLSTEGFYIDEEDFVKSFKDMAFTYSCYANTFDRYASGVLGQNTRVLTNFTKCLEATISSLIELQKP